MDPELLLRFIGYFPDYLSALSRTLLRFFGQPLSKQLYTYRNNVANTRKPFAMARSQTPSLFAIVFVILFSICVIVLPKLIS